MAMLCMAVSLVSCSPEDGQDGQDGAAGPQGIAGVDGADGISCWDLNGNGVGDAEEDINDDGNFDAMDCQGADGVDGINGNANVLEFHYNLELEAPYSQLTRNLNTYLDEPLNYAFLFYLDHETNLRYSIPGHLYNNLYYARVHTNLSTGNLIVSFYGLDDTAYIVPAGEYHQLVVIAIEITQTGKTSENIMAELKAAGVDTSDYNQVAAYFGLE